MWYSGYLYYTTSFNKTWTQVLRRFKSCSRPVGDSRRWGSPTMVLARNNAIHRSAIQWKQIIIIINSSGMFLDWARSVQQADIYLFLFEIDQQVSLIVNPQYQSKWVNESVSHPVSHPSSHPSIQPVSQYSEAETKGIVAGLVVKFH